MEDLLARLTGPDPAAAREAALELGDREEHAAVPTMLEILATTSHDDLRDGVAYALSAMRVPEILDVITGLLRQDRTRGNRGTLLYALRPFDCTPILPLLVDLVLDDTWESSREAAYLITSLESVPAGTWLPLHDRLLRAMPTKDPERRETITFLTGFFTPDPDD